MIGATQHWLSLLKTMVLLYIKIRVDLATSYQFCLHLDENNLKSTFLKNAFLHMYVCLKIGGLKLANAINLLNSPKLVPAKI